MTLANVEDVSMSLVREFLKRKGLIVTYQTLEQESPKTPSSISNRKELAKSLQVERLVKKNKDDGDHVRTILEIITKCLMDGSFGHSYENHTISNPKTLVPAQYSEQLLQDFDLETETFLGSGMENVITQQVVDALPTPHPAPPPEKQRTRRPRPHSIRQHSQDFLARNHKMIQPSQLKSGTLDSSPHASASADNSDDNTSNNFVPDPDDHLEEQSVHLGGEVSNPEVNKLSADVAPPLITASSTSIDDGALHVESPDTRESSSLVPKPPPKVAADGGSVNSKSDLEKTAEMLRLRRLSMQKHESLIDQLNASSGGDEEPDIVEKTTPGSEAFDGSEDLTAGNANELLEEESYSPRIICSPLEERQPVADVTYGDSKDKSAEPNTGQKTSQLDDTKITKQPVQYMTVKQAISSAKSIDIQTAMELKRVVIGSPSLTFPDSWLYQSLSFCDLPNLLFGLTQRQPGPCGLIAAAQASFIIELLFGEQSTGDPSNDRKLSPHAEVRCCMLSLAISKILWRCGEEKCAVLVLPGESTMLTGGGRYKSDGITENLVLNMIENLDDLKKHVQRFLAYFVDDDSHGAILLLYSAVLSRGIEQVVDDMDSGDTTLITEKGFCSPEMVNLLLCGKAASNVFNDSMEVTTGIGKTIIMKGIPTRSAVGLLSLFEHQSKRYQVGTFLKTPRHPVWIILIDGHYTVVFCVNKDLISDWKAERRFDLIYYDSLAKQDEPIKLTIDTTNRFFEPPEDDESVPPLELCLRTKWRDAQIDWNGSEPIFGELTGIPDIL